MEERWLGIAHCVCRTTPVPCLLLTLSSFLLRTGRYLLPNPVAGQAWPASAETSNLVRMRSQALGQSAPSLTASLVSVLCVVRVALAIFKLWSVLLFQANHGLGNGHTWLSVCRFLPGHSQMWNISIWFHCLPSPKK